MVHEPFDCTTWNICLHIDALRIGFELPYSFSGSLTVFGAGPTNSETP